MKEIAWPLEACQRPMIEAVDVNHQPSTFGFGFRAVGVCFTFGFLSLAFFCTALSL